MSPRLLLAPSLLAAACIACVVAHSARAQAPGQGPAEAANTRTIAGPRNAPLAQGAEALQAGNNEEGVRLTLEGLKLAEGPREQETALSNLCAGYLRLRQFESALEHCNKLLELNENSWRGYNTRALVHLELKQYEQADQDLKRAEAINPNAQTIKVARAMYNDVVRPVVPEVEIDDRNANEAAEPAK